MLEMARLASSFLVYWMSAASGSPPNTTCSQSGGEGGGCQLISNHQIKYLHVGGVASHLDVHDGAKLAEVLVELGDVVELSRNLTNLQLGVDVVIPLWEAALMLVVEVWPEAEKSALDYGMFVS